MTAQPSNPQHRLYHFAHGSYIDHDPMRSDYPDGTEFWAYFAPMEGAMEPHYREWRKEHWRIHVKNGERVGFEPLASIPMPPDAIQWIEGRRKAWAEQLAREKQAGEFKHLF